MPADTSAFAGLASWMAELGLGDLFTIDSQGQPGGWLWNQLQQGVDTQEELLVAIENTDAFKDRFSVIVEQKARAANGEPGQVMTVGQVIAYEQAAMEAMSRAGLPTWFYDEPNDFNQLILGSVSVLELEHRLDTVYSYVDNAPPEVQAAFRNYYGIGEGRGALASYVLDPERTIGRLEKARRTAYTGGMAEKYGMSLTHSQAVQIEELGMGDQAVTEGYENISAQENLFDEGLFEDTDLTAEGTGISATFFGDADSRRALERRQSERRRNAQANTGGAIVTNTGVTGAGSVGGG